MSAAAESGPSLPHSLDAEQAVLGAVILNNGLLEQLGDLIEPAHFFEPLHGRIFEKAAEFVRRGRSATPVFLGAALRDDPALAELGGQAYLNQLAAAAVAIVSPREYAQLVHDLALRRELILIGNDVRECAFETSNDMTAEDQITRAETQLFSLAERGRGERGFETFMSAVTRASKMIEEAYTRKSGLPGVATGFRDLDRHLGGLHESDLIILAARPGMGKTALATNIAFNVARAYREERGEDGRPKAGDGGIVGFFSLEMASDQLASRIIAEQSGVPSNKLRLGNLHDDDWRRISAVCADLHRIPLYIDETGAIPISTLAGRARRLKRRHGLGLIVVDYLQLMTTSGRKRHDSRVQEVTEITTGLKALAKDLSVPVLALSQLSRNVEHRDDKRPTLADLRESGSIEQDADVVMFIYREHYYLKNQTPDPNSDEFLKWQAKANEVHGKAEILIEKHRHGPTGKVEMQFNAELTRFGDLAPPGYGEMR